MLLLQLFINNNAGVAIPVKHVPVKLGCLFCEIMVPTLLFNVVVDRRVVVVFASDLKHLTGNRPALLRRPV